MISDERKNLDLYRNLGIESRYAKAVDFLKSMDLEALEPGKYEIDGKNVHVNVATYTTIPWEEAEYGTHEHYADTQYVIEGNKIMNCASAYEMTVKAPHNLDKDVVSFEDTTPGLQVVTGAGQYLIFNPWDAHKPKTANGEPALARKVTVKIKEG